MKNCILLKNNSLPGCLEASIGSFVERYHYSRYRESLGNLMPSDVYFGRDKAIIDKGRTITQNTIDQSRLADRRQAALRLAS